MSGNSYIQFIKRNPNFLLIWLGQILSQSGGRMYQMAMMWWILSATSENSGKLVGGFMVMAALPGILLVKIIGKMIDGSAAKKILVRCDLLATIVVGSVAAALTQNWLTIPLAFIAGFLAATLQSFLDPTLNKAVGDVVNHEDVEGAVTLLASTQSLANFTGAVAGAVLIDWIGVSGTAVLAAFGYLISAGATALANFQYAMARQEETTLRNDNASGWEILNDLPLLKKILIGFGLINFFATPTLVVLPLYVKTMLHGSAALLGKLEASLWLGLIAGTVLSKVIELENKVRLGAICLAIFGLALATPGIVVNVALYLAALFVAGTALGINNVKFVALFQTVVPTERKGRFFALMQALISFTFPIAYFLFGAATDYFRPSEVCLIQGIGVVLLAGYFFFLSQSEVTSLAEV